MIVVDAGVWVTALVDSGHKGEACRRILSRDPDWVAPCHAPIEALRTIRRFESAGLIETANADVLAAAVREAEVRYIGPNSWILASVWEHRHNISPYDMPYVAVALRYGVALVTLDERLARAALESGAEVVVPRSPSHR